MIYQLGNKEVHNSSKVSNKLQNWGITDQNMRVLSLIYYVCVYVCVFKARGEEIGRRGMMKKKPTQNQKSPLLYQIFELSFSPTN